MLPFFHAQFFSCSLLRHTPKLVTQIVDRCGRCTLHCEKNIPRGGDWSGLSAGELHHLCPCLTNQGDQLPDGLLLCFDLARSCGHSGSSSSSFQHDHRLAALSSNRSCGTLAGMRREESIFSFILLLVCYIYPLHAAVGPLCLHRVVNEYPSRRASLGVGRPGVSRRTESCFARSSW